MSTDGGALPAFLERNGPARRGPIGGARGERRAQRDLAAAMRLADDALEQTASRDPRAVGWVVQSQTWTSTGTAVARVGRPGDAAAAVLRLSPSGAAGLLRETVVLDALGDADLPSDFTKLLPQRLGSGQVSGCPFAVDLLIDGTPADAPTGGSVRSGAEAEALTSIGLLHRRTAREAECDAELLRRWVDIPLDVVSESVRRHPRVTSERRVAALREELATALTGRRVAAGWVHGDFWAGNMLLDRTGALTGIVDWDLAAEPDLPVHDVLHLLLHGRRSRTGAQMGDIVADLVRGRSRLTAQEAAALESSMWCFPQGAPDVRVLVLLAWLRHVAAVSVQQRRYVSHSVRVWELRNVHRVLHAVGT